VRAVLRGNREEKGVEVMFIDTTRYTTRPDDERIRQELAIYDRLEELSIPYVRVDHDHADTIQICQEVEKVLGSKICKNLFLCNRQQTDFYLLMMPGDKPFKTKFLSAQLGCSRLSFADGGHMRDYLQTIPGSVSAMELLFDTEHHVQLVIDRELMEEEFISGHPGISTSTLQLRKEDLLKFVASTGHTPIYIDLPDPRRDESLEP
jgi:Ala-tRNA(Pro) deacylase